MQAVPHQSSRRISISGLLFWLINWFYCPSMHHITCLSCKSCWESLISTEWRIFGALWLFCSFFCERLIKTAVTSFICSSSDQLGAALWSFHTNQFDAAKAITAGFDGNGSRILRSQFSLVPTKFPKWGSVIYYTSDENWRSNLCTKVLGDSVSQITWIQTAPSLFWQWTCKTFYQLA